MHLKYSVRFGNSELAMSCALLAVNDAFKKYGYEFIITSANDSSHGNGSLHYRDCAFDCRTKHVRTSAEKQNIITEIKQSLVNDFDIVFENAGLDNEHLHIEYQKK